MPPMVRSTMMVPGPGFGLMSEPIMECGESAANALLPAAPVGMPPPPPPSPPPPPPHAERPSKEDNITEVARSLRVHILILLSVTIRPTGTTGEHTVNSASGRTLPGGQESARFRCGFAPGPGAPSTKAGRPLSPRARGKARLYTYRT